LIIEISKELIILQKTKRRKIGIKYMFKNLKNKLLYSSLIYLALNLANINE